MLDHIYEIPLHLPDSVCDHMIKKFHSSVTSSAVASTTGGGIDEDAVCAEDIYMGEDETWATTNANFHDIYVRQGLQLYLRHYNWINWDETRYFPENAIMSRYPKNTGIFKPHQDASSVSDCNYMRSVTIITYLNTVAEGGETYFPNQNLMMHPRKGSMLFFPSGFTHAHEGRVPRSEDKYIIVTFAQVDIGVEDETQTV